MILKMIPYLWPILIRSGMEELNEILKKVESGLVQSFSGSILRMTYERKEQLSWQSGEVERCWRSRRVD